MMWRTIPDFPDYEASAEGVIRRRVDHPRYKTLTAGHIVPQWLVKRVVGKKDGTSTDLSRLAVSLYLPSRGTQNALVNRMVCHAFHGAPPSPAHQAAHNDGDVMNNRASNLRWATATENQADRVAHGTSNKGSRHGMAKISESDAATISDMAATGMSQAAIRRATGVSRWTVWAIASGRAWQHAVTG